MTTLSTLVAHLTSGVWTILAFLFVLTIVVVVHELGHFLVARWCGVKVESFALGFGDEIYGWNDRLGTRWRLNWIPLGGYVKFMDDANAASFPDAETIARMTPEERATSFHAKPLWQRAAVIAAGPAASILLGIVLLSAVALVWGVPTFPARVEALVADSPGARAGLRSGDLLTAIDGKKIDGVADLSAGLRDAVTKMPGREVRLSYVRDGREASVNLVPDRRLALTATGEQSPYGDIGLTPIARIGDVTPGSPAEQAGLASGDRVIAIDGAPITTFSELQRIVVASPGRKLALTYVRGDATRTISITPDRADGVDAAGAKIVKGMLGLISLPAEGVAKRLGPIGSIDIGVKESYFVVVQTLTSISNMIGQRESAAQLGGPLRIANESGKAAKKGLDVLLRLAALLSLSVGLLNLFPIPILDGGRLLFYAVEAVLGRPLSGAIQELGFKIGFTMILMLIVFVMWNDRSVLMAWSHG